MINSKFPPAELNLDTIQIYKALNRASRALAELKGKSGTIPNEEILINTLSLQEAKDSSEIENIITTQEDLYLTQADNSFDNLAAKEVLRYSEALKKGFALVKKNKLLTVNFIIEIQEILEPSKYGLRKLPGTVLKNSLGETVFTPPQNPEEIILLMSELEKYINNDDIDAFDPLIKMALIHYQFESIHPFYDGNGRTGRIINILYLVIKDLLNIPVLYLSRYIVKNKQDYYKLLQGVREKNKWEEWVLWMLQGVEETALNTMNLIVSIQNLMDSFQSEMLEKLPKIYSKELLENLFKHPYTKIEFVQNDLRVSRKTASKYLESLVDEGFLRKENVWKNVYFVNDRLYRLFKK